MFRITFAVLALVAQARYGAACPACSGAAPAYTPQLGVSVLPAHAPAYAPAIPAYASACSAAYAPACGAAYAPACTPALPAYAPACAPALPAYAPACGAAYAPACATACAPALPAYAPACAPALPAYAPACTTACAPALPAYAPACGAPYPSACSCVSSCGPAPCPLPILQAAPVTHPTAESPLVVLPHCPIPAPRTIAHKCMCTKTVVKPQIVQRLISVPSVQRYLKKSYTPVVENIAYCAKPSCCESPCGACGACGACNACNACAAPCASPCALPAPYGAIC